MKSKYNESVAYFSPTNGTERSVKILAENFNKNYKSINLTKRSARLHKVTFSNKDLLIAAAPVYAGQLPMVEGLFENLEGDKTPCIVMATYGNRHYDDTLAQLKNILEEKGFICIGAIASVIPHVFSDKLGLNRPDEEDVVQMKNFADKIIKKLDENKIESVDVPGEIIPKHLEKRPGGNVIKTFDINNCSNCGLCVRECPVNAINPESKLSDSELCINCMRCSFVCKSKAKGYDAIEVRSYLEGHYMDRREIEVFV